MNERFGTMAQGGALLCCVAAMTMAASAAVAAAPQPERAPEAARELGQESHDEGDARARALSRLDHRLEWTRRMSRKFAETESRILDAKVRIAAGEDPNAVMHELRRQDAPNLRIRISHEHENREIDQEGGERHHAPERRRPAGPESYPPATPEQKVRIDRVLEVIVPGLAGHLQQICETERERCDREYAKLASRMHDLIQDGVRDEALFELRLEEMRVAAEAVRTAKQLSVLLRRLEANRQPPGGDGAVLATRVDSAPLEAEIAEARAALEAIIAEQHDIRGRIRQEELVKLRRERDRIQRQIDELEAATAQQALARDRIIAKQVAEAIEQAGQGRGGEGPQGAFDPPERGD